MYEKGSRAIISVRRLILVPALITLGVTLARLIGELQGGPRPWFNSEPGGGGALVGIAWLVPVFGFYFGRRLAAAGEGPSQPGRVIGMGLLAFLLIAAVLTVGNLTLAGWPLPVLLVLTWATSLVAATLPFRAWPALGRTLIAYGLAARLPVVVVTFFAMAGRWNTHYDSVPPDFPQYSLGVKFLALGAIPQLVFWVAFTVIVGSLFGGIAAALSARRREHAPSAG